MLRIFIEALKKAKKASQPIGGRSLPQARQCGSEAEVIISPPRPGRSIHRHQKLAEAPSPGSRLAAILAFFSLVMAATAPLGAESENKQPAAFSPLHLSAPAIKKVPGGGLYLQSLTSVYQHTPGENAGLESRGDFQALFLDQWGRVREDSNGNQVLDQASGPPDGDALSPQGDLIIRLVDGGGGDGKIVIQKGRDEKGRNEVFSWKNAGPNDPVKPVWSLGKLLSAFTDEQIIRARGYAEVVSRNGETLSGGRRIYTAVRSKPSAGGGEADHPLSLGLFNADAAGELCPPSPGQAANPESSQAADSADLINYILGLDRPGFRNRTAIPPGGTERRTWRLGAVNEAGAVVVGAPSARHHLLYGDLSYLDFQQKQTGRRQMAYFGSDDGIFHAVNLGFFQASNDGNAFRKKLPDSQAAPHELGTEIWGFLPPALLPELKRMAGPRTEDSLKVEYLQPLVADIKTAPAEGRWRTVLIGGVRLEDTSSGTGVPPRRFSEFFALDVTDPEKEPLLLWTFRHDDLGPAQSTPAVVSNQGSWYVLIAGGPTVKRSSGEPQGTRIFALEALSGRLARTFDSDSPGAVFTGAFTSISADYLIRRAEGPEISWTTPLVYFSQSGNDLSASGVYRLQMIDQSSDGKVPRPLPPAQWRLEPFCRTPVPVVGPVNSAQDARGNRWVFFTTAAGSPESPGLLYGIKEAVDTNGFFVFKEVDGEKLLDLGGVKVYDDGGLNGAPAGIKTFVELQLLLGQSGEWAYEGYKRSIDFKGATQRPAGGLGQPKIDLLGNQASLLAFTSYAPEAGPEDILDGRSRLNLADAFTGLPAPYLKPLAGQMEIGERIENADGRIIFEISGFVDSGPGRATETVIIKTGRGGTIIKNISPRGVDNSILIVPGLSFQSGLVSWREVKDMGLDISEEDLAAGLEILD